MITCRLSLNRTLLPYLTIIFLANDITMGQTFESKRVYFWHKQQKVYLELRKWGEVWVNEHCVQNSASCAAYKIYQTAGQTAKLKNVAEGNYAADYCVLLGGTNVILIDNELAQYQFCTFPDQTLIDSWALYHRHRQKE